MSSSFLKLHVHLSRWHCRIWLLRVIGFLGGNQYHTSRKHRVCIYRPKKRETSKGNREKPDRALKGPNYHLITSKCNSLSAPLSNSGHWVVKSTYSERQSEEQYKWRRTCRARGSDQRRHCMSVGLGDGADEKLVLLLLLLPGVSWARWIGSSNLLSLSYCENLYL